MSKFEDYAYNKAREGILAIKDKKAADIYVLSFYFWANEDEPRQATLTVGYNTNAQWHATTPDASGSDEAKWNYAFWLQEKGEVCVIGESRADAAARKEWMQSLKVWYSDEEAETDRDRSYELDEEIMVHFVGLCISVAKRLHDDGVITKKFGRPVPIVVHELEYHDGIAEATRRANPKGLAKEFAKWIAEM